MSDEHLDLIVEPQQVRKPGSAGLRLSRRALLNDPRATQHALVALSLRRALTSERRDLLLGRANVAAIVVVPTTAWVIPVLAALRACAQWHHVYEATGPFKIRAGENVEANLTTFLAGGGRVLGITADPAWLPPALTAAADILVTLLPPDARVLTGVIAALSEKGATLGDDVPNAAGLDFPDIVAAIRKGSTPADCVRRLARARRARVLPDRGVISPSLDDLHGYGPAMDWAKELVCDLADWRAGNGPFPTGSARAVLAGPPGTGKTSLVAALARSSGMPLVSTSVAQWFSNGPGYLDSVIKAIDSTFAQARAARPAVVLLDEIDAVPDRAQMTERDRSWWSPVVNHLLAVLDSTTSCVADDLVVIGCTNHAHRLDAALTRPGRLERVITVMPTDDPVVREAMLRTHLRGDLADADLTMIGLVTAGATGATLMSIVRDARRRARVAGRPLGVEDLLAVAAPPSSRPVADERRYAVHECGHAAVALALGFDVETVSLLETATTSASVRMGALSTSIVTRAAAERRATVLLGGMAAEEAVYGDRSMGAGGTDSSDLAQATESLTLVHSVHGMGARLSYAPPHAGWPDPRVAVEVERDLQRLYRDAKRIVREHGDFIQRLVPRLVASRFLTGAEVRAVHDEGPAPTKRRRDLVPSATAQGGGPEEGGPSAISRSPRGAPAGPAAMIMRARPSMMAAPPMSFFIRNMAAGGFNRSRRCRSTRPCRTARSTASPPPPRCLASGRSPRRPPGPTRRQPPRPPGSRAAARAPVVVLHSAPNDSPKAIDAAASSAGPRRSAGVLIRSRTSQVARAACAASRGPRPASRTAARA